MGFLLAHFDHHFAGYFTSAAAVALMIILYLIPKKRPLTNTSIYRKRHPLDLRPAFKKPSAFGYILAYGAHSYELFALRTWCFAFLVFLATNVEVSPDLSLITVIVSVITLTGMFSSLIGAHFCLKFGRHKVIAIVGGCAAIMSLIVSLSLKNNFWTVVIFIWFYHSLIMMDSGSLTAGTVEEGDVTDRGALLAVHSMVDLEGELLVVQ